MSFHLSAEAVRLEKNHLLVARLRTQGGQMQDSSIDLNSFLGNSNGVFQWDKGAFSSSARNVSFQVEGGEGVPVLRAQLRNLNGEWMNANVNLSERVKNVNGCFTFV